jgi:hypothetical protein
MQLLKVDLPFVFLHTFVNVGLMQLFEYQNRWTNGCNQLSAFSPLLSISPTPYFFRCAAINASIQHVGVRTGSVLLGFSSNFETSSKMNDPTNL